MDTKPTAVKMEAMALLERCRQNPRSSMVPFVWMQMTIVLYDELFVMGRLQELTRSEHFVLCNLNHLV